MQTELLEVTARILLHVVSNLVLDYILPQVFVFRNIAAQRRLPQQFVVCVTSI